MTRMHTITILGFALLTGLCARTSAESPQPLEPALTLVAGGSARAVIVPGPEVDRSEQTAVAKLNAGIVRDSGVTLPIMGKIEQNARNIIVIGTAKSNPELRRIADHFKLPIDKLEPQEFLLRTRTDNGKNFLIIAGGDARGVFYGAQEALDQVITTGPKGNLVATVCNIQRKPAIGERGTYCLTCWGGCPRYPRTAWEEAIDAMADGGMNRVMFWMDGLFRSTRHPDAFLNKAGQHYHDTPITEEDIHKLIVYAHDRGVDFYLGSGVFAWFSASEHFAKKYKEASDTKGNLCPSSPLAQKLELEYLSEMNDVFPEADGYMLEIRDELDDCMCEKCQKPLDKIGSKQFGQSEMDFLQKLTTTVWEKHPKTKFIWLMGYANHGKDPMYYDRMKTMGADPRLEWLEVRMSWTLPTPDGKEKPLKYFSDRVYHWDPYYRLMPEHIQDRAKRTVIAGLNGYLPAYEPGFANMSVYATDSPTPFPVRLIPFCATQFYYREFTWDPWIEQSTLLKRAHRKFFTAEVPEHFADDFLFLRQFMANHRTDLTRQIGAGLGPDGSGLIATVKDVWTVPRKGGDERKQKLLEGLGADIRGFASLVEGTRDMARLNTMEKQMNELRPNASRRSIATFDIIQRAITDIRAEVDKCVDYKKEYKEALAMINDHLKELEQRKAKGPAPKSE